MLTGGRVCTHKELITNLRYQTQSALENQPLWHAYVAAARSDWENPRTSCPATSSACKLPSSSETRSHSFIRNTHACTPSWWGRGLYNWLPFGTFPGKSVGWSPGPRAVARASSHGGSLLEAATTNDNAARCLCLCPFVLNNSS